MKTQILYTLLSVILVSLLSVIAAIPILLKKKFSKHQLLLLLSLSVGAILSTVFFHMMPEISEQGFDTKTSTLIIVGFLSLFIIEKLIHWHHNKNCEKSTGHSHAYHIAPINLIGDGIHNFIDGLIIAGSFAISIPIGIATTIAIIFHELPQELADIGVLLYSGLSKKKAMLFNLFSALTAIIGAIIGIILIEKTHQFAMILLPFAAGNFIYIAASNLVPQLHRHCDMKDSITHILAIIFGILIILLVTLFTPEHLHG